jgi:sugar phosphate isomerase/epimerase
MAEPRHRYGIVASSLTTDPREAPRLARLGGFEGLLFDAYAPSLSIPELSVTGRREFRHVLAAQDRQLIGLRCDLGPKGFGPGADADRALSRLERAMDAAAGLQAPLVTVDLGPLPRPPAEPKAPKPAVTREMAGLLILPPGASAAPADPEPPVQPRSPADESFESQLDAVLADLGGRADRYGVVLAFRSELAPLASLERALRRSGCPWFGVDLDPVSLLRDEWPADEAFSRLGSLVRHVRARDAIRGTGQRTTPAVIGAGSTNWAELLSNLDAAGYHGWITLDPTEHADRATAAAVGLKHLQSAAQR